jgi:hypothetical protein
MVVTENLCETPGCKNRGLKYLRNDKFLCRKCARKYDGKADIETAEERESRGVPAEEND